MNDDQTLPCLDCHSVPCACGMSKEKFRAWLPRGTKSRRGKKAGHVYGAIRDAEVRSNRRDDRPNRRAEAGGA